MIYIKAGLTSLMREFLNMPFIKGACAVIVLLFIKIHGPWTPVHWAALIFIVADLVIGTGRAILEGSYKPTILREKTAIKLIGYGLPLVLAYQVGRIATSAHQTGLPFWGHVFDPLTIIMHAVGVWIAVSEWESIGRNMHALGFERFPTIERLFDMVRRFKQGKAPRKGDSL